MRLTKDFIAGFICGEGCFTFQSYGMSPVFQLGLSIKDRKLLMGIVDYVGIGNYNESKTGYESCVWTVTSFDDCKKLIEFLDKKIVGDKKIDFDNWKRGIKLIEEIKSREGPRPKCLRYSEDELMFIHSLRPTCNRERKRLKWNKETYK